MAKKRKQRNKKVDYAVYLVARLFIALLSAFDIRTLYSLSRTLGKILFLVDRRHRTLAIQQIGRSFPEWDEKTVNRVARQSLQSIVMLGMETLVNLV